MKKKQGRSKGIKIVLSIAGAIILLAVGGYFLLQGLINRKLGEALKGLSPGIQVYYSSIDPRLFSSSLVINDLVVKYRPEPDQSHQHYFSCGLISINGINFFKLLSSKKLAVHNVRLENCRISLDHFLIDKKLPAPVLQLPFENMTIDQVELAVIAGSVHTGERSDLSFTGDIILEAVQADNLKQPDGENNFRFGSLHCRIPALQYLMPDAYTSIQIKKLDMDSKKQILEIDSCKIVPGLSKFELGKKIGHQTDYIKSVSSGIKIEKLDLMQLFHQKLIAGKITVRQNNIYVFRDRRLPLKQDTKALPVEDFRTLSTDIRVNSIMILGTTLVYEEYPKDGHETGTLRIERLHASIAPFINHPVKTDPAYMDMKTEGSLMGSGDVEALTQLPLRQGEDYIVGGAFHNLDLTTLNASAENLGRIHIESGMLDYLSFQFDMSEKESMGKIVGEYHQLVIDKLKTKTDEKKVDKFKTFFLKKLIIPKNKDKTLAVEKRTGKVNYKRDPERYFSYYLLHSLLVGIRSSFSLGFLLPG